MANRDDAWFVLGVRCLECGDYVKACDAGDESEHDYEWFCINGLCKNNQGSETFDDDRMPSWAVFKVKENVVGDDANIVKDVDGELYIHIDGFISILKEDIEWANQDGNACGALSLGLEHVVARLYSLKRRGDQ